MSACFTRTWRRAVPEGRQSGLGVTDGLSSACDFVLLAARRLPLQVSCHHLTVPGGSQRERQSLRRASLPALLPCWKLGSVLWPHRVTRPRWLHGNESGTAGGREEGRARAVSGALTHRRQGGWVEPQPRDPCSFPLGDISGHVPRRPACPCWTRVPPPSIRYPQGSVTPTGPRLVPGTQVLAAAAACGLRRARRRVKSGGASLGAAVFLFF